MKTKWKRILATIIDYSIIEILFVICNLSNMPTWFWGIDFNLGVIPISLPSIGIIIVLIPIAFKDFLFKNASLGKKLMGLEILDNNDNIPSFKVMLQRGILMPTLGYIKLITSLNWNVFEAWEIQNLHTKVVKKQVKQNIDY